MTLILTPERLLSKNTRRRKASGDLRSFYQMATMGQPDINHSWSSSQNTTLGKPSPVRRLNSSVPAPEGHMSCIFTDIIDSTNLWECDAEQMWGALNDHDTLIRREIFESQGYEVKTAGDSFFIVFSNASDALRFCLDTQTAIDNHHWPPKIVEYFQRAKYEETESTIPHDGLVIRMGLHFGKPYKAVMNPTSQRMDYYGPMINTSARIQSQAEGGQIAVSDEFIREVWRILTNGKVDTTGEMTNATRMRILRKFASPNDFDLKFNEGPCRLKGVHEKVHITLICLKKRK